MGQTEIIKAQLMDGDDLQRTLDRMACQIVELFDDDKASPGRFGLIGMQRRGVHLARRLQTKIREIENVDVATGVLDATMYRDDFRIRQTKPVVRQTEIPFDVTGRHIVLVDDVLYTGRTARAALDAIMDVGRPSSVRFVAIIDRGLRELPIQADIVGRVVPTLPGEEVRVMLSEIDEDDGVWLVETTPADSPGGQSEGNDGV